MTTITLQEVEMLASLMTRAGVSQYEAIWANAFLERLRQMAREAQAKTSNPTPKEAQNVPAES